MTGGMAQCAGRLLCKYEDLSLSLGPVLKARHRHVKLITLAEWGRQRQENCKGLLATSMAKSPNDKFRVH